MVKLKGGEAECEDVWVPPELQMSELNHSGSDPEPKMSVKLCGGGGAE